MDVHSELELQQVAGRFQIHGRYLQCRPFGKGHIHRTYLLDVAGSSGPRRYILQQVNSYVFPDVPAVMENIVRVTSHLCTILAAEGCPDIERRVLSVVPSADGSWYYLDDNGRYWRVFAFIADTTTVDIPANCEQIYQAAKAFGRFLRLLSDLPGPGLNETIRDFHSGQARLAQLKDAVEKDPLGRARNCSEQIHFVMDRAQTLLQPGRLLESGALSEQVTHNDTKVNNVLVDIATGEGLCVIDLDTVMNGLWIYDLGDILRTTCTAAEEDEQDLSKISVVQDRYMAAVDGFLTGAASLISAEHLAYIPLAGKFMALIMAARFLADFIMGDRYFKASRPGHNLDRCRAQCQLVRSMEQQQQAIARAIHRQCHGSSGPKYT